MSNKVKRGLGALILSQPKEKDYVTLASDIATQLYSKIVSNDFTLSRSAVYDNNNKDTSNNGSLAMVSLNESDKEWVKIVSDVQKRFVNNNLNAEKLSDMVVESLKEIDVQNSNYLDDVDVLMGYKNQNGDYYRLSILDNPTKGIELRFNLVFKLKSESRDNFIKEYNGSESAMGVIYGKVDEFYYLDTYREMVADYD